MDIFKKGWFTELSPDAHMWPGQALSIEIESTLFDEHSEFQHVQVFETKEYGTMLCLDGVIQVTERDEFGYQEVPPGPAARSLPAWSLCADAC